MLRFPNEVLPTGQQDETPAAAPTPAPGAAAAPIGDGAVGEGRPLRRPARAQDLYLSTRALAWLADLPQQIAPRRLAHDHPRIVNRLALCWCDPVLATLVLDSLLVDRRGGRRGFVEAVQQELRALRAEAQQRARPDAANEPAADAGG